MRQSGSSSSCMAVAAYTTALFLFPLLALAIGWIGWDFKTGAAAGGVMMVILLSVAASLLILVREPSAWLSTFPLIFGAAYAILPDFILFSIDDGLVFSTGALLSFLMWRKRKHDLPLWLLLPLLGASAYTFVGGIIPGPFDEIIVYALSGGAAWWKLTQPFSTTFSVAPPTASPVAHALPPAGQTSTSPDSSLK